MQTGCRELIEPRGGAPLLLEKSRSASRKEPGALAPRPVSSRDSVPTRAGMKACVLRRDLPALGRGRRGSMREASQNIGIAWSHVVGRLNTRQREFLWSLLRLCGSAVSQGPTPATSPACAAPAPGAAAWAGPHPAGRGQLPSERRRRCGGRRAWRVRGLLPRIRWRGNRLA